MARARFNLVNEHSEPLSNNVESVMYALDPTTGQLPGASLSTASLGVAVIVGCWLGVPAVFR